MQRAVHIWKKLLRTATESKQVQDVTAFLSAEGSGWQEGNSQEGGMEMQQMGFWGPIGAAVVFGCRAADGNLFDFGVSAPSVWGDV